MTTSDVDESADTVGPRWRIPLSDLDLGDDEVEAVTRVLRRQWLTTGPETSAFEAEFAEYCGVDDAVFVSSATAGLHMACLALGVTTGVEVIVPTMTFVATANAVALAGGHPVLADSVGGGDFGIDVADVERRITPRTRGVICVHYGGESCDLAGLQRLCRERGLFLVEDAAHASGARSQGRSLGTVGDIGCFSFFGNKNLTTGEGGMVIARDVEHLREVRLRRSHGMTTLSWDRFSGHASGYDVVSAGLNYRPTELSAAIGRVQLARLDRNNAARRQRLRRYENAFRGVPDITVPVRASDEGAAHLAVILVADRTTRDRVRAALADAGVQTSVHYTPVHLFRHYRETYGHRDGDLPVAEDLGARCITLPLFPTLPLSDVDEVAERVVAAVQSG